MSKWVSVNDTSTPTSDDARVDVWSRGEGRLINCAPGYNSQTWITEQGECIYDATHWMLSPAPPE